MDYAMASGKARAGWQGAERIGFLAAALLLSLPTAALTARAPEAPAQPLSPAEEELARLRDFLTGPDRTFATRRDTAEVLLEKNTDQTRKILVEVLAAPSDPARAVLDALAAREDPHEAFIDPLFKLLQSNHEATRRAAALALGAYQGNERVLTGLRGLIVAAEVPPALRLAAIEALAQIVDRESVATLVKAAANGRPEVATAAARALAEMTGLTEFGASPERWAAWWERHKNDPDARFLGGLLRRFRRELRRRKAALNQIEARLIRLVNELYETADTKQKGRLVQAHLDDALAQVRAVAARQATPLAHEALAANSGARQTYRDLIASLLKHVNDESPPVRAASAEALAAWQETPAGPSLLARLEVERVPEVRAALAAALGGLKVTGAVPRLIAMLASANQVEVVKAAGALGSIGEPNGAAAVEPALKPLGDLARTAPAATVREAACRALAKIADPSARKVLTEALADEAAEVRFSAAQGLGNLPGADAKTVSALTGRLQDENKGVRQAVAAALAKLGGPDTARTMADRLKPRAETEPAVRNALWAAIQSLLKRSESPELAVELGDVFLAREGVDEMQRAAALYETALGMYPSSTADSQKTRTLLEKLVDAYVAAGMPRMAVPALRQLLRDTPAENKDRATELKQQLGLILLMVEPYTEAVRLLAEAMDELADEPRATLVTAIQARAEALVKTERPDQALDLLGAFHDARPDWGGTDATQALVQLRDQATQGAIARAIGSLSGADQQVEGAVAALKKIGQAAVEPLLDALEAAAKQKQGALETKILAALQAVTGRTDHRYRPEAPLEDRFNAIEAWRRTLKPPSPEPPREAVDSETPS